MANWQVRVRFVRTNEPERWPGGRAGIIIAVSQSKCLHFAVRRTSLEVPREWCVQGRRVDSEQQATRQRQARDRQHPERRGIVRQAGWQGGLQPAEVSRSGSIQCTCASRAVPPAARPPRAQRRRRARSRPRTHVNPIADQRRESADDARRDAQAAAEQGSSGVTSAGLRRDPAQRPMPHACRWAHSWACSGAAHSQPVQPTARSPKGVAGDALKRVVEPGDRQACEGHRRARHRHAAQQGEPGRQLRGEARVARAKACEEAAHKRTRGPQFSPPPHSSRTPLSCTPSASSTHPQPCRG